MELISSKDILPPAGLAKIPVNPNPNNNLPIVLIEENILNLVLLSYLLAQ